MLLLSELFMLSVANKPFMLSVVELNVFMLSVMAPDEHRSAFQSTQVNYSCKKAYSNGPRRRRGWIRKEIMSLYGSILMTALSQIQLSFFFALSKLIAESTL